VLAVTRETHQQVFDGRTQKLQLMLRDAVAFLQGFDAFLGKKKSLMVIATRRHLEKAL
jgi:hypothetical protein